MSLHHCNMHVSSSLTFFCYSLSFYTHTPALFHRTIPTDTCFPSPIHLTPLPPARPFKQLPIGEWSRGLWKTLRSAACTHCLGGRLDSWRRNLAPACVFAATPPGHCMPCLGRGEACRLPSPSESTILFLLIPLKQALHTCSTHLVPLLPQPGRPR